MTSPSVARKKVSVASALIRVSRRVLAGLAIAGLTHTVWAQTDSASGDTDTHPVELLILGSGGPGATGRASSSYLVLLAGQPRILVDAGPGSFARLGEAKVSLESLDTILLTHLHVDHAAELPGIIKARAVSANGPIHFNVFGPIGRQAQAGEPAFPSTTRFMKLLFAPNGAFAYLRDFAAPITFSITDLPRPGSREYPAAIFSQEHLKIIAIPGHHGDAPTMIYRIDYRGASVVFSGDVDPSGLPALETISAGADLLVFDQVVLDRPQSPAVLYSLHSPPSEIGSLAARAHVKSLLLSHLSPAVDHDRAAVTESIAKRFSGPIKFASDGLRLQP